MMDADNQQTICPVCNEPRIEDVRDLQSLPITRYKCGRCGTFDMDRALAVPTTKPWAEVAHFVSAWVRRENKAGITPNIGKGVRREDISNPEWWKTQYGSMGFPTTTIDKLNKLLQVIAENIDSEYDRQFSLGLPHYISEVAAKNGHEVDGLMRILDELELIDKQFPKVTAKGWLRIDELKKVENTNDSAFIAMWFSLYFPLTD